MDGPNPSFSKNRIPPAVVLFFLSPMIAELLSGSSPPAEFFNPFGFLILTSLYGSGAIIVREIVLRWNKGWASLLMLGAAYGIVEEGLMMKSFFDPTWMDLDVFGTYGRWAGVNWVWAIMLTIYHAIFSIAIPILLVELMFPLRRRTSWVSSRIFKLLMLLILAVTLFGYVWLTPYRPPFLPYIAAIFAVMGMGYAAWKLPRFPRPQDATGKPTGFKRLVAFAFLATLCYFVILYAGPLLIPFPVVMILAVLFFVASEGMLLAHFSSRGLTDIQEFALASGALGVPIIFAPLQEFDKTRPDNPTGMALVGFSFLVFLAVLGYKISRRIN